MPYHRYRHFLRAHPAVGLVLSFGVGIVVADRWDIHMRLWLLGSVGLLALLAMTFAWPARLAVSLRPLFVTSSLLGLMVGLGGFWFTSYYAASPSHVGQHPAFLHTGDTKWTGEVKDCEATRTRFRCTVRLESASIIQLPGHDIEGHIHIFLPDSLTTLPVAPGDVVTFVGKLLPPTPRRNPGDFDYGRYLWLEKIAGTVWLNARPHIAAEATWSMRSHVQSLRQRIREHIYLYVDSPEGQSLTLALLLGERGSLSPEVRAAFTNTGLAHLLAVSGLHVMLVGFVLYRLLGSLLGRTGWPWHVRQGTRTVLTLGVLVAYLMLTGAPASVVRAVVMTALLLGASVVHRPHLSLNALGIAALVLLIAKPGALFQAGFQLSFAAVSGIVVFYPRLMPVLSRITRLPMGKSIAESTAVTLAATWTTAPVLLAHFGSAPLAGLLLNLFAIPLTAALLMASLLLVTLGTTPALGVLFGGAIELAAYLLATLAQQGQASLSWATLRLSPDTHGLLLPLVLAICASMLWALPRWRWRVGLASFAVAVVLVVAPLVQTRALAIVFFDVGHGDAALVSFPSGEYVLVDTGGYAGHSTHAERTLLPYFERYGISDLEAVVVSHPHADHDAGLGTLLDAVSIKRIIYNGDAGAREVASLAYQKAESLGVPLHNVHAGDTLQLAPNVKTRVLWPPLHADYLSANNQSIVIQLLYEETGVLFLGDVEGVAEMHIAEQFGPILGSSLVKVAHHGSRTSSQPVLVTAITLPTTHAVISADRRHRYGLPDEDVEQRWLQHGVHPLVTSDHGALWFILDGRTVKHIDWR